MVTYHKTHHHWLKLINRKRGADYAGFSVNSVVSVYSRPSGPAELVVPVWLSLHFWFSPLFSRLRGLHDKRKQNRDCFFFELQEKYGSVIWSVASTKSPLFFFPTPKSVQFSARCRLHSQDLCLLFREGHTHSTYKNKSRLAWQCTLVNRFSNYCFTTSATTAKQWLSETF